MDCDHLLQEEIEYFNLEDKCNQDIMIHYAQSLFKTNHQIPDEIWQKVQDVKNYMVMNNFKTLGPVTLK